MKTVPTQALWPEAVFVRAQRCSSATLESADQPLTAGSFTEEHGTCDTRGCGLGCGGWQAGVHWVRRLGCMGAAG